MRNSTLGIEIAKRKFNAALLHEAKYKTCKLKNGLPGFQKFQQWLAEAGAHESQVCLEATGGYAEALAIFLIGNGFTVSIVNPYRKGFGEVVMARSKTGKLEPS